MKTMSVLAIVILIALPGMEQEAVSQLTPTWVFTLDSADEFTEYPGGVTVRLCF